MAANPRTLFGAVQDLANANAVTEPPQLAASSNQLVFGFLSRLVVFLDTGTAFGPFQNASEPIIKIMNTFWRQILRLL